MRVRCLAATTDAVFEGGARKPLFRGDEYDLPDDEAERLIAAGAAEAAISDAVASGKEIAAPPADKMVRKRKTKSGGEPV